MQNEMTEVEVFKRISKLMKSTWIHLNLKPQDLIKIGIGREASEDEAAKGLSLLESRVMSPLKLERRYFDRTGKSLPRDSCKSASINGHKKSIKWMD